MQRIAAFVAVFVSVAVLTSCSAESQKDEEPPHEAKRVPHEKICGGILDADGALALKKLTRSSESLPEWEPEPMTMKGIGTAMRERPPQHEEGEARYPLCSFRAPPAGVGSRLVTLTYGWSDLPRNEKSEDFNYFAGRGSLISLNIPESEDSMYFPCPRNGSDSGIVKASLNDSWTGVDSFIEEARAYTDVLRPAAQKLSKVLHCRNSADIPTGDDITYLDSSWKRLSDDQIPKALLDAES